MKSPCGLLGAATDRRPVWFVAAALAASAGVVSADEDWRKLADRQPPVYGPVVTGEAAQALLRGAERGGDGASRAGFSASGVTLLAHLPLNAFSGSPTSGNDCWGYTSPSGREYAIMGLNNGFGFVEVTDPLNPVVLTRVPGPNSMWHDVKVIGDYAYGVSEGGSGIQVMDLRQIDDGIVRHVRNWTSGGYSTTHNIAANPDSKYLYLCGANVGNGGLVAVDVNDPENPVLRAAWTTQYVHDAQIVTYTEGPYAGREIAFCSASGPYYGVNTGLAIVDVTNKNSFVTLANVSYPGIEFGHQAWLSPDRRYLYLNDELDDGAGPTVNALTRIFDVSDPATPTLIGTFSTTPVGGWIDHNLYTKGNYIYEANYTGGLRVFDATNPTAPTEIAHFDTRPESNGGTFNGAWSTYPYFESGTVLVSDIERGLFLVRVDAAIPGSVAFDFPAGLPERLDPGVATPVQVQLTLDEVALQPDGVTMHVRLDGGSAVQIPMSGGAGGVYTAAIPGAECFSNITYWFTAATTDGRTFASPSGAPAQTYRAAVMTSSVLTVNDTLETNTGWTVGAPGDNAVSGVWTRVNPNGTAAQPEDDHTPDGTMCYVTGQGSPGGGVGDADVDSGRTTLLTPFYDLSEAGDAVIGYWRWYSNDKGAAPNADVFRVQVTADGTNWVPVETVGPSGPGTSGGWIYHEFNVRSFVTPSATVRLRFIAEDAGSGSVVEAAIDDLTVTVLECEKSAPCRPDFNGDGALTAADFTAFRNAYLAGEMAADFSGNGTLGVEDFTAFRNAYLAGCP